MIRKVSIFLMVLIVCMGVVSATDDVNDTLSVGEAENQPITCINDTGMESDSLKVTIVFKNKAKYTKILKAKFIFYNPKTQKTVSKLEYSKFKNGKWEMPDKDYSFRYLIWKAKVYYISYKT